MAEPVRFSDISQDLLDHGRSLVQEMGVLDRCEFVRASADDLSELEDACADAVTMRSILIYVKDKRRVFEEFHRVLKPGERLSILEPLNRFNPPNHPSDGSIFMGTMLHRSRTSPARSGGSTNDASRRTKT